MKIRPSTPGTTITLIFSQPLTGVYDLEVFACIPEGLSIQQIGANCHSFHVICLINITFNVDGYKVL